jgi:indoleamine 2,3-dioxygenase
MVSHTPKLVKYATGTLEAAANKDRAHFDQQLAGLNETYETINREMEMMWSRSLPGDYVNFRTFIMGTKNQVKPIKIAVCLLLSNSHMLSSCI